ncbi:MAG: prepilin peptidase [Desulfobacteraceae bacterium]|nr:prepilin peptidase [Desulfobacteraceae bacterium]
MVPILETGITPILLKLFVFFTGLCIGSFLNVCIHRLPSELSIIKPASCCPKCGNPIRWLDNIPIISYILLRGSCRICQTAISIRYPLVEFISGLFALATYLHFGLHIHAIIYFLFICGLLTITFIDIDHQIIPDIISLPGIPIGFAASFLLPNLQWTESLLGLLLGGGSLYLLAIGYQFITGNDGMGGGDIKLLAMIGAFIGWKGVFFTVMVSSFIGTAVGLLLMIKSRKGIKLRIPFGPFLSIGAILYLFFGPQLIYWYLNDFI